MTLKLKAIFSVVVAWAALSASAQTLAITNGIQKYSALTSTTVTMTGRCELWVTNAAAPLTGCTINLNSADAWFFLPNIRPSIVSASYLSQVKVNGANAVAGSNCRVDQYAMGSVIVPHAPGFTPLQIFSGPNFVGASSQLGLYTFYTGTALGALNRNIGSFKLKRGYSATFAQNTDGTGASEVFVAQDGDLEVGMLAASLNRPVSFVRVFPWRWTGKRGWDDTAGDSAIIKPLWFYDWGSGRTSDMNAEYAPMQWGGGYSTGINSKQKSTQVLGFNEPDSSSQANLSVAAAIANWPSLMQSGLRVGAPAVSDSGVSGQGLDWLYGFMSQATNLGYRVDFIPIHWYKCGQSATQLSNYLASVYQRTGRPIWLTEFNYGANWCDVNGSLPPTPSQEATAVSQFLYVLENAPFVERYSIYNWVTTNREMVLDDGTLTTAGVIYVNQQSAMAYKQTLPPGGSHSIAQFQFEANTLDSSGYGNNGFAVGIPGYTAGHTGQALSLDGTNSFLQLPPNVANSPNFTFAAWVYWNGGADWQRIFDFGDDTAHYLFLTPSSGSGTLRFAIKNGGSEQIVETTALPIVQWTHVAVTRNGNTVTIYTNGVPAVSSGGITIAPSSFNPNMNYLGKSQFSADPLFNGNLDEVQIADYAFTAAQIASLQTNQPPQFTTNFLMCGTATPFVAFSTNVTGTVTDPDPGDSVTYSKASGATWLTVNSDGTMTGTPGSGDGGTNYFTVRAADTAGASAFAVVSIIVPINYASGTWSADASGSWDDATKWSGAVVPNGGNGGNYTADFSTLNITADRTVSLDSSRTIGNLKFGDTSGSQNWILTSSGSTLTLNTGSSIQPTIVVNQNAATIAAPLADANGFAKSGAGTLILSNANTLGGTVYIDTGSTTTGEGAVRAAYPGAFGSVTNIQIRDNNGGSSTFQLDGSAGNVASSAAIALNGRNNNVVAIENFSGTNTLSGGISINVGGGSYLIQSDAGLLALGGTITAVATGNRFFTFQGSGDFLISGSIQNGTATNGIVKTGSGTLTFAGINTYTNTTTISGGTLRVNGTNGLTPVTVANTATLGGKGVVRGAVTIQSGGTLAPGTNSASIGVLTVSNSVTLQSGSTTRIKISKTPLTNDVLRVTGAAGTVLTYGGTLTVSNLDSPPTAGDRFKIFQATAYNGTFAALNPPAPGIGLAWNTTSLTNGVLSVVATVPPQFGSIAQLGDGNFQFGGSGAAGVSYELDAATNLASPIDWSFVTNAVADQNGSFQFADLQATNFPQRFYRIIANQ
jgi:autotransporter-associated beta strand protein